MVSLLSRSPNSFRRGQTTGVHPLPSPTKRVTSLTFSYPFMPQGSAMVTSSRCAAVAKAIANAGTHAGNLDDLWEGEMLAVRIGTVDLVMCNVQGQVFAYADRCPHLASRLSDGRFDRGLITCATHEWVFDARGGSGVNP